MYGFSFIEIALLILAGLATGFINVIAGGGSMISVPALIFLGIPGPIANGTNRIGILAQSASSVIAFFRKGLSDFRLSLTLGLCTLPGAIMGAFSAAKIKTSDFNVLLAGVMIVVMALTFFGQKSTPSIASNTAPQKTGRARLIWGHICMIAVGFWGGFIQIGVGFILIPILNRVMGFDLLRTNMHKVTIVFIYTIVALIIFARELEIAWAAGLFLAVGNIIGGWVGARSQIKKGNNYIQWVINLVLIIFIIKLLFFNAQSAAL